MELRILLMLVKKNIFAIAFIALLTTIGGIGYSLRSATGYEVAVGLVTGYENTRTDSKNFYQFDGFYASQAAERFSQVIVGVLKGAATAKEIYDTAGIPIPSATIKSLGSAFKPQKNTERVVEVTFGATSEDAAQKLATALGKVMDTQAEIATKGSAEGSFRVMTSKPVVTKSQPLTVVWGAVGMLIGLLVGISFYLVQSYLKAEEGQ